MNSFCIFILTYGRPHKQATLKTLKRNGVTAPIYLICSDDDLKLKEYQKEYGDTVKIFNKKQAIKECNIDLMFNDHEQLKAVIYARHFVFKIAKQLKYQFFVMLDDDYSGFHVADFKNKVWRGKLNLQYIFQKCIDFYAKNEILLGFSTSQGGDFIGGITMDKNKVKRKAMNVFFCDTKRPLNFKGIINEDTNFYIDDGAKYGITMQIHNIKVTQHQTQTNQGGLTDIYLESGTYVKSFYSVILAPSAVKVSLMMTKNKRPHHKINYNAICPKILRANTKNGIS